MNRPFPLPRPEYETANGYKYFKVGDIVRLVDPLDGADEDRGVVIILANEWHIVWMSQCENFDEISGDSLHVLTPEEKEREGY